jgi:hypothetical protein
MYRIILFIFVFIIISSCQNYIELSDYKYIINHNNVNADVIPDNVINKIKQMDIYFEHASVGGNIVDGLNTLTASNNRYNITITNMNSSPNSGWFLANNGIGENNRGNPGLENKVDVFYTNMSTTLLSNNLNIAMFKFCFIDSPSNPSEEFTYTKNIIESLERQIPGTVFVWWTMPIETNGNGNYGRNEYNKLVRNYCSQKSKFLLDIADIECYSPDNIKQSDSSGYEILYSGYASDNGHLNTSGALRVANALWVLFSRISK